MPVYEIDPLRDARWPAFLDLSPQASVFHTPAWLEALRRAYGYQPIAFTTSPSGQPLENGIVFCRVDSRLTGSRLVSAPFSDHCQPLVERPEDWAVLSGELQRQLAGTRCRYIELRPLISDEAACASLAPFAKSHEYYFHKLDLRPDLNTLFSNFHKSCIQRKIQRGEREGLTYEAGRSESILAEFYQLLLLTRRRHQLPAQPAAWFRNLVSCFDDGLTIRVISKDGRPVASILTLDCKSTLVYKYGCSDPRFHNLGGMPLLFWKAIQEGKQWGAQEFDLGRADMDNPGLATFKEHLGAEVRRVSYFRLESSRSRSHTKGSWQAIGQRAFTRMPNFLAQIAGNVLYRHMG